MITLINHSIASKAVNAGLQLRRLNLYSLSELEGIYYYEKNKVLLLCEQISKIYDVNKLNFAFDFNIGSRYVENCRFINQHPKKDELIQRLILFYITKYLIENYLLQLEEIQAKI